MGAKVQSKTCFPGSMTDLNNGFCNGDWDVYHDDKNHKIFGPGNGLHYDYFQTRQVMDGYAGYAKGQIRETILKHESIFRHQLQELHRLYKRQRDLMNPVLTETSNSGHFLSQNPSEVSKEARVFASAFPLVDSSFTRASTSKPDISERRVIDLELPADVDQSNNGKQQVGNFHNSSTEKVFNFADLNEPIQVEESGFSASVSNKNTRDSSTKRTIFGVEICERNHTPSFDFLHTPAFHSSNPQSSSLNSELTFVLPWRNTTFSGQNGSTLHLDHGLASFDSMRQNPEFFAGNSRSMINSRSRVPYHGCINNSSTGFGFLKGMNSNDPVSDSVEEREKHKFMDMWKNRETPEPVPAWLMAKPCLQSEKMKTKETTVCHMNLDSLQNRSQQFFKKPEMEEGNDTREFKKVKTDDTPSITKILGVPIIDLKNSKDPIEENGNKNDISDIKHIDLNLSLDDEGAPPTPPSFPESVVKIATMEIDLEAPLVLEPETNSPKTASNDDDDDSMNAHVQLVQVAAEAIVSISSSKAFTVDDTFRAPQDTSATTLWWFAEVITSRGGFKKRSVNVVGDSIPEGMDYFEYMTLNLKETEEDYVHYRPTIVEDEKEDDPRSLSKRTPRKGRGRRGKDFQKDILPSIVSLSRREVTEDLQTFEEAFSGTGVSWQSSMSKRKTAARNGRGRRHLVVADSSSNHHPPPPLPPPPPPQVVEQTVCREVALEKSLGGWGRRTRRLPRQRCPNTGNHHSLALKC